MDSNGAKILLLGLPPRLQFSPTKKRLKTFTFLEEREFSIVFYPPQFYVKAEFSLSSNLFYFEKTLIYSTLVL